MDPFTEKLLERTRARRENLQKKMADRPNAANRPMSKRSREPLGDTNSVLGEPLAHTAAQPSTKPSPSKRLCSGEKIQPALGEENQEPQKVRAADPPTDKKPPAGPGGQEKPPDPRELLKKSEKMVVAPQNLQPEKMVVAPQNLQPEMMVVAPQNLQPEKMVVAPQNLQPEKMVVAPQNLQSKQTPAAAPTVQTPRGGDQVEDPGPPPAGMRSRLQRLAEQRKCWDGSSAAPPDAAAPPSPPRRQEEVPALSTPPVSSGNPIGRRGRLANLAATIGSWEDDLSHAHLGQAHLGQDNAKEQTGPTVSKWTVSGSSSSSSSKTTSRPDQSAHVYVKPPSSQRGPPPGATSALQQPGAAPPQKTSCSGPQKSYSRDPGFTAAPHTPAACSTTPAPNSPQKNQVVHHAASPQKNLVVHHAASPQKNQVVHHAASPQKNQVVHHAASPQKNQVHHAASPQKNQVVHHAASPQKPELRAKPALSGSSAPLENKAPGVKSFMERFGERCQERTAHSSPAGGGAKTPSGTPSSSVTPNTRLVQERLRAAQAANTATADLTQRHRMERESELAQIRSRFQNGNMWKNKEESAETKRSAPVKEQSVTPKQREPEAPRDLQPPAEEEKKASTCSPTGEGVAAEPLKVTEKKEEEEEEEEEEVVTEVEMNVDQSMNSAVISQLFNGALHQSDEEEEEEEEEEDALNISSMSLLTPLAETVAAVVKSPERRMMTSTPACSFIIKSPEKVPGPFQRMDITGISSSDGAEAENYKLLYSVDAYRSIRVKEKDRAHVKQVIVRNQDVPRPSEEEEPRGAAPSNIKHRTKVLTQEMNLQQTVIHQASQALNCCTDEEHGKGSQVEAEAERLLRVAVEKRSALKSELERLRAAPGPRGGAPGPGPGPSGAQASRGSVSLQELRLPLKADFVCAIANKPDSSKHSFFVLLRAGADHTVASPLASTHRGLSGDTLTFNTNFTISDVSSDFSIDVEVYCLVQKREVCSDKKKKPSKSKAITPKRLLGITRSVQTPVVASPGGPNAVRTSNFALVGSHTLTLASIGKNKFPLEKMKSVISASDVLSEVFHSKVPFLCPLEGHVFLKLQCELGSRLEERGFLTMFEDVSGFGAWHRRWCVLSGHYISYWTYPDDQKCKKPMGRIDLLTCSSRRVEPANREFCARPNTFELVTVRAQRDSDKETLVSQGRDRSWVTTNWVSADTKDERNLWMRKLNQALVDLRTWQPHACHLPL